MRKGLTALLAGLLVGFAGCSYQDFARPPVRNYVADIFYEQERPPEAEAVAVQRAEEMAEALVRWQRMVGPAKENYTLGPGDVLKVSILVRTQTEASLATEFEVNADGTAPCPFLGDIQVAGLTTGQVEEKLAATYRDGYYRDPAVSVIVSEHRSKQVFITGAVETPGVVYLNANRITLLEAVLLAGGLGADAGNRAEVTRIGGLAEEGGDGVLRAQTITADIGRLIRGPDMVENIWIDPGDVIHIMPAEDGYFYIMGYVNSPGVFPFPNHRSFRLMDAIAYARGLSGWGHPQKVYLHRGTPDGFQDVYRIDLTRIASAAEPDVLLQPGDRIIVGTGWGRRFIEGLLHSLGLVQIAPLPGA